MIAKAVAIFGIELRKGLESVTRRLLRWSGDARAATRAGATTGGGNDRRVANRPHGRIAHRGMVRIFELAVFDFLHARETFRHDGHVRGHDVVAEAAEFFLIL